MRTHGVAASRKSRAISEFVSMQVWEAMWSARVHREARLGARIVAGQGGEVLRVDTVGLDGYGVRTTRAPLRVRPDVLDRKGAFWVESDLKNLGDAPPSVGGNERGERPPPTAPSSATGSFDALNEFVAMRRRGLL